MPMSSYPFDGQDTTEDQYSRLFTEFQDNGVGATADGDALKVSADGTDMTVDVQPGFAYVRGHAFDSTDVESVAITAPTSGSRYTRIILRLDPGANSIDLVTKNGSIDGPPPTIQNDPVANQTGIFELGLGYVLVSSSDTAISNSQVTDERSFVGLQSGVWPDDSGRPTNPRLGKPGYNMASQTFEYWNGTDWSDLSPTQPGDIIWSARTSKRGHILCDGTLYDETTHPRLFSVIGRTYGGDENDGTFAVPDLSDRAAYGASGTKPLGTVSGSSEVTLTEANLPAHTHSIDHDHGDTNEDGWHDHGHRHNNRNGSAPGTFRSGQYGGSTIYEGDEVNGVLNNASEHTHTVPAYTGDSGSTGSDSPVTIEPPQVALNAFIKL